MTDVERLTRQLQAEGPDEFPEGYYRHLAEERLNATVVHYIHNGAMTHAVPNVLGSAATRDPDKVTCEVCRAILVAEPPVPGLEDLQERLQRAVDSLEQVNAHVQDPLEVIRITGKIEGVKLALSYVEEMLRG